MSTTILVPEYLKGLTADSPPGHRFQLYLGGWQLVGELKLEKNAALQGVLSLGSSASAHIDALQKRQAALAAALGGRALCRAAKTISPFVTGVGIEHPVENGFAFLSPYGIPYLPGSGIKGVLRRAAEELAFARQSDWDLLKLWLLFGFENSDFFESSPPDETAARQRAAELEATDPNLVAALAKSLNQQNEPGFLFRLCTADGAQWRKGLQWRGALRCWDAFLAPARDALVIEILTPHHTAYYEAKNGSPTPADCESPKPIPFLAIPPGSSLNLVIECVPGRLPETLRNGWTTLAGAALEHACSRLGFGAKTAVGYGAFELQRRPAAPAAPPSPAAPAQLDAIKLIEAFKNLPGPEKLAHRPKLIESLKNAGQWRPEGNPAKDKVVKRTQEVLAILRALEPQ